MLWDRGWWAPEPGFDLEKGLKRGEIKLVFSGERMRAAGSWSDQERPQRRQTGELAADQAPRRLRARRRRRLLETSAFSIASGRTMEIASGKGRAPTPFMAETRQPADAVWSTTASPKARDRENAAATPPKRKAPANRSNTMPKFVPPQLLQLVDRPPAGGGGRTRDQVRRLPDATARPRRRRDACRTRTGLDWSDPLSSADQRRRPPAGLADRW